MNHRARFALLAALSLAACVGDNEAPAVPSPGSDAGSAPDQEAPGLDAGAAQGDGGAISDATTTPDAATDGPSATPDGSSLAPFAPPRPLAPMSTATVSSGRPKLTWQLPQGVAAARVEICATRACATAEQVFDVTGAATKVPATLAPGVHFWRVRAKVDTGYGIDTSPTWSFYVPAPRPGGGAAPIDSSWGHTIDVDGDGLADVVASNGVSDTGRSFSVYRGARAGITAATARTIVPVPPPFIAEDVAGLGDVDGDGFGDVAIQVTAPLSGGGRADSYLVYRGGIQGLALAPSYVLDVPATVYSGPPVGVDDVDGDGYADVYMGWIDSASAGHATIVRGGPGGPSLAKAYTVTPPSPVRHGFGLLGYAIGDFDGDGFADFVADACCDQGDEPFVFKGSATGPTRVAGPLMPADVNVGTGFGRAGAIADMNGDGYTDFAVGSAYIVPVGSAFKGRIYGFFGGATFDLASDWNVTSTGLVGACGVSPMLGDLDGDGYVDLVSVSPCWDELPDGGSAPYIGRAYVYGGSATPIADASLKLTITAPVPSDSSGSFFGNGYGMGDTNGDGHADFMLGTRSRNFVYLYAAYPAVTAVPLQGDADGIGGSVAR